MDKSKITAEQLSLKTLLWYHFYPGIAILLGYILMSQHLVNLGYPGLTALLVLELLVLAPIGLGHLSWKAKLAGWRTTIPLTAKLSSGQYFKWSIIGILACIIIYVPMYPLGLFLRSNLFYWLPEWYFDPGFGTDDIALISKVFFAAIFIDGIIGPVVEELFFRGYLLPRMSRFKQWAPIINGALFGLYHFWQPHNYFAIIAIGIILSYVVWRTRNVFLGIIIHCTLNIMGALTAYLAASGGELILR